MITCMGIYYVHKVLGTYLSTYKYNRPVRIVVEDQINGIQSL